MAMTGRSFSRLSYRTPEEVQILLHKEVARLSPEELEILSSAMQDESLLSALMELEYDEVPVSPEQFLEDDRYFGLFGRSMHERLKSDFVELFTNGYEEIVLSGSLGWGKSYFSSACLTYDTYKTLCLRDPQRSYGLAPGSQILSAVVSLSIEHARSGVMQDLETRFLMMPVFREKFPCNAKKSGLFFPSKNMAIRPENYAGRRIIGLNVFSALIDEANFAKNARAVAAARNVVGKAKELFESVMRRRKSRYQEGGRLPGICAIVSSATVQSAFTIEKMAEAEKNPQIFVRTYATWDVNPSRYRDGRFSVLVASGGRQCRILTDDEAAYYRGREGDDTGVNVVDVPVDFRSDFDKDIIAALREIAGIPADSVTHLFPDQRIVDRAHDGYSWGPELEHGFTELEWECEGEGGFIWERLCERKEVTVPGGYKEMTWIPKVNPDAMRFAHIDTSVNGDATGICVGHVAGYVEVVRRDSNLREYTELAPRIVIDLILRILPPPGGDIRLGAVRALLYEMQDHGFVFALTTTDGFQSVDTRQKLDEHGIKSELASMDRDDVAYMKLQAAYVEGRVRHVEFPYLAWELTNLVHDRRARKVDHPAAMIDGRLPSKDVSDALAGVVSAIESRRPGMRNLTIAGVGSMVDDQDEDEDDSWVTNGRRLHDEGPRRI